MVGIYAVAAFLVAALSSNGHDGSLAMVIASQSTASDKKQDGMENLFERALNSTGPEYVQTERQLRRLAAAGEVTMLDQIRNGGRHPDPLAALLAEVLLAARGPSGQDYENLELLFVNLPESTARTPLGAPPPDGVRSFITRGYGARATRFLALRLAKEPDWPRWLAVGTLLYLGEHKDAATTAAILRFAIITPFPERRALARDALVQIADPALPSKVADAQLWADARKLPFPPELRSISTSQ